jgi:integrase
MATIPASQPPSRPELRLFNLDDGPSGYDHDHGGGKLSAGMRLSEFFAAWFLVIVLEGEGSHAGTVTSYRESIAWWVRLTGDPPIDEIDEYTVSKFKTALREATYRRGKSGPERSLGKYTINKHFKQIRAVLRRAGPTLDPAKPGKRLVDEVPHIGVVAPKRPTPKRPFAIEDCCRIVIATNRMPSTRYRGLWQVTPRDWWHAFVVVLFYTGLRSGTVLKLAYSMLDAREDGHWLVIPGSIVDKTEKPLEKFLHPAAVHAVDRIRTSAGLMFPWPHWRRHIKDRHDYLQQLAGIEEAKWLSPHAWRRTHSNEMNKLGAEFGRKVAQRTLDHEDERTTSGFYTDIEALLISRLPLIDTPANWGSQQLTLF